MLYREAARVLQAAGDKKGSVKNLILSSKFQNKKALYAIVFETLKYKKIIKQIITSVPGLKKEKILKDENMVLVMLYDLLFGHGISGKGLHQDAVRKHKAALSSELARIKVKAKATKNADLLGDDIKASEALPRYVRVNTLKTTQEDVIAHFKTENYVEIPSQGGNYARYQELVRELKPKQFTTDPHVPELLVFPSNTDLHDHVLYTRGDIIFQDKASCLPAFALNPPPGSHVIDCCAAPGNKTTHLAAILGNKGKIFAFDKDAKRLGTMNTLTLKAGVLCAQLQHKDFLTVKNTDPKYAGVEYILVDPSCSGSGIVNRMNMFTDSEDSTSEKRLESLSNFQTLILKHALSFPALKRLVYSTCSLHHAENEAVVAKVMRETGGALLLEETLRELPGRGMRTDGLTQAETEAVVRTRPGEDLTNGFFVACFVKNPAWKGEGQDKVTDSNAATAGHELKSQEKQKKKKDSNDGHLHAAVDSDSKAANKKKKNGKKEGKEMKNGDATERESEGNPKSKAVTKKNKRSLKDEDNKEQLNSSKKAKLVANQSETNSIKKKQKKKKIKHKPVTS